MTYFFFSNSNYTGFARDSVNYAGLGGVLAFYLVILGVGLFASWKSKSFSKETTSEDIMLAGRSIGAVVGVFTMTGRWMEDIHLVLSIPFTTSHHLSF